MTEKEIKERFLKGIEMFTKGMPQPTEREYRIESLGWRHAKKTATDLELAIEMVVEAYCELDRDMTKY